MSDTELAGNWNFPTSVTVGAGSIVELAQCCIDFGMRSPLIVTDHGLAALPMIDAALSQCRDAGLFIDVFSKVKSNPSGENVADGVVAYRTGGHDGLVAFGGGSAIDACKAIALMVGQSGVLWDYEDSWQELDPDSVATIIAVPTTAGTGSEVGRAALVSDEQRRVKKIVFHPKLLPSKVILDPELTRGLPASMTAATGMDALSHNLEAFCSPVYHPMAEGIAIEGIRLVKEYLPRAVADGDDMTARMQMIVASSMGATAFQKGLGAMHALAHPLGALYDAHHGLLNAILMPYVLVANREEIEGRIQRLARYLDLPQASFGGFLAWVLSFREEVGIPHNLLAIGIDLDQQTLVGEMAAEDPTAQTNPLPFTAEQYSDLFSQAVSGEL